MVSVHVRLRRPKPYGGNSLSIVIGIDVGTTFSGVSYAILRPGEVPEILPVTKFSGLSISDHKIPSVIYYDESLHIRAIGAATTETSVLLEADEEGWIKAEHFKLHLRPPGQQLYTNGLEIGGIPEGKTAEEVMGDYLRYLYEGTAASIRLNHSDGEKLWDDVKDRAIFVLGHPNGWKGVPQQRYRRSAVLGGLVPDTAEGHRRIRLVTEGEASGLACLSGGLGPESLQPGFRFVIADAGGGTIDISTFEVTKSSPVELMECTVPDSRFAGSLSVNQSARRFLTVNRLTEKLRNTKYNDEETMREIMNDFEHKTKRQFSVDDGFVKIPGARKIDKSLGIARGHMKLNSSTLSSFFEMSLSSLADSIKKQLDASHSEPKSTPVWLVGGFASSPCLQRTLKSRLSSDGVAVECPDTNLAKAVANGAVLHFLDSPVRSRACSTSYGTTASMPFMPFLPEHRNRLDLVHPSPQGLCIGPIFDCIAQKGTSFGVDEMITESYVQTCRSKESARNFSTELLCYDGDPPVPKWYKENEDKFREVCKLEADLSELCCDSTLLSTSTPFEQMLFADLGPFWRVKFEIELKFGSTELEAFVKWEVDGETKRGPAKIVHNMDDV